MVTQKFMGRNQLIDRLTAQVGSKETAMGILRDRGHIDAKGELTAEGRKRNAMTAEERAKDRAVKKTGKNPNNFIYNPKTNTATQKRR